MKFEFDGEKYKQASSHQKAWGRTLISELELRGDERILDLGCGNGALTAELAELVPDGSVLGIDASESMIATARRDHAAANLRFELEDINNIGFEAEFDVVFSNATLNWVKNHRELLANVYRCLKDRGTARLQFAGEGNCSNLIAVLQEAIAEKDYAGYFDKFEWPWYMPAVKQYRELLDEAAFAEKRVWIQDADKYFESEEAMVKWIDQPSLVPFLSHVAGKDRQRFRDAVVERMIERTGQSDGTCFETFRRINVLARK
ncbi:MAG: class I SAM-dependent methyltransferase [Planctomycetota bacterium]|jgi:trans-aconitate methyltransferase